MINTMNVKDLYLDYLKDEDRLSNLVQIAKLLTTRHSELHNLLTSQLDKIRNQNDRISVIFKKVMSETEVPQSDIALLKTIVDGTKLSVSSLTKLLSGDSVLKFSNKSEKLILTTLTPNNSASVLNSLTMSKSGVSVPRSMKNSFVSGIKDQLNTKAEQAGRSLVDKGVSMSVSALKTVFSAGFASILGKREPALAKLYGTYGASVSGEGGVFNDFKQNRTTQYGFIPGLQMREPD